MVRYLLSYANNNYIEGLNRIKKEAESLNIFDNILCYTYTDLKLDDIFWNQHGLFIDNNKKGGGYWLWKSYLILKTLNSMKDNDIPSVYNSRNFNKRDNFPMKKRISDRNVTKTRPCRNIVENGSCNRTACMFAHNETELQISICSYGNNCFRKNEENLRDGQTICKFKHPDETEEDYYIKLGLTLPLFPQYKDINVECFKEDVVSKILEAVENGFNLFHVKIIS